MTKQTRRRGSELDNVVLDAAWNELMAVGYTGLTMDAVARRAKTSRQVLYRRWADKSELTVAAIQHYLAQRPVTAPALSNVREELLSLMRQYADRGLSIMILTSLAMNDFFKDTNSVPRDLRRRILEGEELPWHTVMLRAAQRGEIDAQKLTPLVASIPQDLLRHEFIMTQRPPTDEFNTAVIDEVFLPLVRPDRTGDAPA